MNKHREAIFLIFIFMFCAAMACAGDTIDTASAGASFSPGTLDSLEWLDLGLDPESFLFTANSMYNYNGDYLLDIIEANIDPSKTPSLAGVPTTEVIVDLGGGSDSGGSGVPSAPSNDSASTPEPSSWLLLVSGCLTVPAVGLLVRHRVLQTR